MNGPKDPAQAAPHDAASQHVDRVEGDAAEPDVTKHGVELGRRIATLGWGGRSPHISRPPAVRAHPDSRTRTFDQKECSVTPKHASRIDQCLDWVERVHGGHEKRAIERTSRERNPVARSNSKAHLLPPPAALLNHAAADFGEKPLPSVERNDLVDVEQRRQPRRQPASARSKIDRVTANTGSDGGMCERELDGQRRSWFALITPVDPELAVWPRNLSRILVRGVCIEFPELMDIGCCFGQRRARDDRNHVSE